MERDSIKDFLSKLAGEREQNFGIESTQTRVKRKYFGTRSVLFLASLLIILSLAVFGGYKVFKKYRDIRANDSVRIISEVGKLVEIPKNETPTIATITNLESIKNQTFFKEAKVGDKVLIFNLSKKAILYRPSTKRIISIAPLYSKEL